MMLWLHYFRPRPAWYNLHSDARQQLEAAWRAAAHEACCSPETEYLGEYSVRGQSTQERVQVWRFPDAERIESFWAGLLELDYADWRVSDNVVGVPEIPFTSASS